MAASELSKRIDSVEKRVAGQDAELSEHIRQNAREHKELSDKIDGVERRLTDKIDRMSADLRAHMDKVLIQALNRESGLLRVLKWCGNHPRLTLGFMACVLLAVGVISVGDIGTLIGSVFGAGP